MSSRDNVRELVEKIAQLMQELTELEHRVNMLLIRVEKRRIVIEQILEVIARDERKLD